MIKTVRAKKPAAKTVAAKKPAAKTSIAKTPAAKSIKKDAVKTAVVKKKPAAVRSLALKAKIQTAEGWKREKLKKLKSK